MATALVTLALSTIVLAAPFPPYDLVGNSPPESNSSSCTDSNHHRTQWSIVYSCLGVIFASVWVSFHPNIPARKGGWFPDWLPPTFERPVVAVYMLVFPEMLVGTALLQRWAAGKVSKKYEAVKVMGGFWDPSTGPTGPTGPTEPKEPTESTRQVVDARAITSSENLLYEYDSIIIRGDSSTPAKVAIRKDEIFDRSKGDGLGKLILVVQTLWFVTQYLGRWIDHLPRTQLEVMTLAYAALAVVVYCLWWHKPLNVQFPITVHRSRPTVHPSSSIDDYPGVGLFQYGRLPDPTKVRSRVIMTTAMVAVIFGGIHCLAWNFPFPTSQQRLIWRICATFITAGPVFIAVIFNWGTDWVDIPNPREVWEEGVVGGVFAFLLTCYVIGRGILFVITLLALRYSPPGVYQTIPWASFIPHLG